MQITLALIKKIKSCINYNEIIIPNDIKMWENLKFGYFEISLKRKEIFNGFLRRS
jgi:hypothetical protein